MCILPLVFLSILSLSSSPLPTSLWAPSIFLNINLPYYLNPSSWISFVCFRLLWLPHLILSTKQARHNLSESQCHCHRTMDQLCRKVMYIYRGSGKQLRSQLGWIWRVRLHALIYIPLLLLLIIRTFNPKSSTNSYSCNSRCGAGCAGTAVGNAYTQDCFSHDICSYFNNASGGARFVMQSLGMKIALADRKFS